MTSRRLNILKQTKNCDFVYATRVLLECFISFSMFEKIDVFSHNYFFSFNMRKLNKTVSSSLKHGDILYLKTNMINRNCCSQFVNEKYKF